MQLIKYLINYAIKYLILRAGKEAPTPSSQTQTKCLNTGPCIYWFYLVYFWGEKIFGLMRGYCHLHMPP